jgi:hypothetical protein
MYHFFLFVLSSLFLSNLLLADTNQTYENIRKETLKKEVQKHIQGINTNDKKDFILSTEIKKFSTISSSIDKQILEMKNHMEKLIKLIANDIEIHNGSSGALELKVNGNEVDIQYIPSKNLSEEVNKKKEKLLKANLANTVSIKSVLLAFEILVNVNTQLKENALKATTRKTKETFYMQQAIFVYEMTDIVINLLDDLTLSGKEDISSIYNDIKHESQIILEDHEKQKKKLESLVSKGHIPKKELNSFLKKSDEMINAEVNIMNSWKVMMEKLGKEEKYLESLKSKNELLKFYKENARLQIVALKRAKTIADLNDSIGSLDALTNIVGSLDLLPLDDRTVSQLLGIDYK